MGSILFTHSYFLRFDPKQWKLSQPYPPLGTITAAAVAREAGYKVSLYDTMFAEGPELIKTALKACKPDYLIIYDDGFNYLTKMCLTNMREAAFRMAALAKEAGCKVIACSSDSSDHYELYLKSGVDYVITGEGEETMLELLAKLESNSQDVENIAGLAYLTDGRVVRTAARLVMKELDKLPLAAWDLINISPYKEAWKKHGYFSINIATTRGCPYKCNWCAKPIYGNRYNSRSPEHVVGELSMLKKMFGYEHVWFCDDIFGLKPGWVKEFASLVKAKGLNFRFKIQSRADILLKDDMAKDLSEAGCETIWMGAESGSQKILDAMDKGITVGQIYSATILIRRYGMKPAFFLQFGYLGETKKDIRATNNMLFDLMPDDMGISVSYPLPGTKFYEKVKQELVGKANWTDSNDLDLMFSNTYSNEYYKALHRYIHKRYRRRQAFATAKEIIKQPLAVSGRKVYKAISTLYYVPATILAGIRLKMS